MIHIVPPVLGYLEPFSGRVEIQTLIIHPLIATVDFVVDGKVTWGVAKKPYVGRIELAEPPRRQTLEVRGYDALGQILGADRMILNQPDVPFGVRIVAMRRLQVNRHDLLGVEVAVSVPRSARLERVRFYRGERLVEALRLSGEDAAAGAPRKIAVDSLMESVPADSFVRVVAELADGRESEDARLFQGAEHRDEIDVRLIQLQVLVTDGRGNPVSGLKSEDFEIHENGRRRPVQNLHTAHDVPLVLGLAIDTSDSMKPIWRRCGKRPPPSSRLPCLRETGPSPSTSRGPSVWPNR